MKIGILCEGRLGGEDAQVLEHLAQRIAPQVEVKVFPQGNKRNLFANAGKETSILFCSGYHKVLVVWDVFPRWNRPDGEAQDRQDLQPYLDAAGVGANPCLQLVAIHKELEAWLLADGTALSAVLSRPAHPVSIKDTKNAETIGNPKKALEKLFETHHGLFQPIPQQGSYQPKLMALRIAENLPKNFGALGKLKSFRQFGRALTVPC